MQLNRLLPALALALGFALLFPSAARAIDVGPNSPGTLADDAGVGTLTWTNPGNASASDDVWATNGGSGTTHYLKATNFAFSIPTGSTINGILVQIEANRQNGGVTENRISIVKSDATIGATNKSTGASLNLTTDTIIAYGGSADLWGETWAPSDVNSANFGAVVSYTNAVAMSVARVDHIKITVSYTAPSSGLLLLGVGKPLAQTRIIRLRTDRTDRSDRSDLNHRRGVFACPP